MMLPTDMALVKDKSFRKTAEVYAKDEQAFFKEYVPLSRTLPIAFGSPSHSRAISDLVARDSSSCTHTASRPCSTSCSSSECPRLNLPSRRAGR